MVVLDHKNDYMQRRYKLANAETKKVCGVSATCSTCMYSVYPKDYEKNGYKLYCIHERNLDD